MTDALTELCAVLDEEHAQAVIEHRKAIKAKLTPHAARLLAKQFARCRDPNEAADEMILRGWRGFKPEWIRDHDIRCEREEQAPAAFVRLWNVYPIKDAEDFASALDAFEKAPKRDHELIFQAAEWLKGSLPPSFDPTYRERSKFIPSLARWLRERRYEAKRHVWERYQARRAETA